VHVAQVKIDGQTRRQEEAMSRNVRLRRLLVQGTICGSLAAAAATSISFAQLGSSFAPVAPESLGPNQRQVYLVRQDQSDCTNTNVPNRDGPLVSGNVLVTRGSNGNTDLKIAMTASPATTYHFFLKCVRLLTDITTDGEGVAITTISFPTNSAGNVYAFDMYPEGAPPGNKFQSAQVSFQ
jgi:hypothetical protein